MAVQPVRQYGTSMTVMSEWTVARITQIGTTAADPGDPNSIPHGWKEQRVKINGYGYEDADDQADGGDVSITESPAFKIGGGTQSVDTLVLVRPRGIDGSGNPIYEFIPKGGAGGDCNPVTSVQCTGGMLIVTYGECP